MSLAAGKARDSSCSPATPQPWNFFRLASIVRSSLYWLGHESIDTTQIYLDANLALKEKALAKSRHKHGSINDPLPARR